MVAVAPRNTGPLGRSRGVLFVILISIVTFGIYWLYWLYKSHEEIKEHSGQGIGGVLGLVIGILLPSSPPSCFRLRSGGCTSETDARAA